MASVQHAEAHPTCRMSNLFSSSSHASHATVSISYHLPRWQTGISTSRLVFFNGWNILNRGKAESQNSSQSQASYRGFEFDSRNPKPKPAEAKPKLFQSQGFKARTALAATDTFSFGRSRKSTADVQSFGKRFSLAEISSFSGVIVSGPSINVIRNGEQRTTKPVDAESAERRRGIMQTCEPNLEMEIQICEAVLVAICVLKLKGLNLGGYHSC
ncbi:hypothetical protein B0H16DRAFT_1504746 [Mycena metata]|uniref:Uncharacterized protein n=1 Tax=Mycena metata TaxID=1033252 RepID=A0AAD7NVV7_9AGAR|nr:hypothetical protein B0H16DRAFT_1504746 [Mycena metata]